MLTTLRRVVNSSTNHQYLEMLASIHTNYKKTGLFQCFENCWDSPRKRWDVHVLSFEFILEKMKFFEQSF